MSNITGVGVDINNYLTTSQIAESVKKVIPTADIKFGSGMYPGGMYGISYVRSPISSERAEQEIHYQITPFEDGVSEYAEWTRKNWDLVPRNYFNLAPTWLAK